MHAREPLKFLQWEGEGGRGKTSLGNEHNNQQQLTLNMIYVYIFKGKLYNFNSSGISKVLQVIKHHCILVGRYSVLIHVRNFTVLKYLLCKLQQSAFVPCLSFSPRRQKKRSWLKMSARPLRLLSILYSSAGSRALMLFQSGRKIQLNVGSEPSRNGEVNLRDFTFRRRRRSPPGSPCMLQKSNTHQFTRCQGGGGV